MKTIRAIRPIREIHEIHGCNKEPHARREVESVQSVDRIPLGYQKGRYRRAEQLTSLCLLKISSRIVDSEALYESINESFLIIERVFDN